MVDKFVGTWKTNRRFLGIPVPWQRRLILGVGDRGPGIISLKSQNNRMEFRLNDRFAAEGREKTSVVVSLENGKLVEKRMITGGTETRIEREILEGMLIENCCTTGARRIYMKET